MDWINVEMKKPSHSQVVLVWTDSNSHYQIACYDAIDDDIGKNFGFIRDDTYHWNSPIILDVNYWMPLPAPPNQKI